MDIGGEQVELSKKIALNNTELLLPGKTPSEIKVVCVVIHQTTSHELKRRQ
jgi:hypothetical protein